MEEERRGQLRRTEGGAHAKPREPARPPRHSRRSQRLWPLVLLAAFALCVALAVGFVPVLEVTGDSMNPTLASGDVLLLQKTQRLAPGDICGFRWQDKILLKRVIGGPGDTVDIDDEGKVSVNGQLLDEPYVEESALGECDINFPYQVPENCYFVLGDHRKTSIDSRSTVVGCVKTDQIVGRVWVRVAPLGRFGFIR